MNVYRVLFTKFDEPGTHLFGWRENRWHAEDLQTMLDRLPEVQSTWIMLSVAGNQFTQHGTTHRKYRARSNAV